MTVATCTPFNLQPSFLGFFIPFLLSLQYLASPLCYNQALPSSSELWIWLKKIYVLYLALYKSGSQIFSSTVDWESGNLLVMSAHDVTCGTREIHE